MRKPVRRRQHQCKHRPIRVPPWSSYWMQNNRPMKLRRSPPPTTPDSDDRDSAAEECPRFRGDPARSKVGSAARVSGPRVAAVHVTTKSSFSPSSKVRQGSSAGQPWPPKPR